VKAAFKQGWDVVLRDVTLRGVKPDEIRIRVAACGICGGDVHEGPSEGTPFGHEIAGTIVETGSSVTNVSVGDKIALESGSACGRCDNCRNARSDICTDSQSLFSIGIFGMAEEMIGPAISAIPCDDLDPAVACLSEPLAVAIDMVRLTEINRRSNVLIMGPGPIGLMTLALVKRSGARRIFVSGFKRSKARWELAKALGADVMIDPSETPLKDYDFGCAIDRVISTAPPPTLNDAFAISANAGIISFIGIGHGEDAFVRFNANEFHFKKLQLRASLTSPALYTPEALDYLREGVVDGEALISHRFALDDVSKAMAAARNKADALKVVVTP